MKKLAILPISLALLSLFVCLHSCESNGNRAVTAEQKVDGKLWIVEDKHPGYYMMADRCYLRLSNIKTRHITTIEVGKYTYEHTNPGDTIEY